MDASTFTAIAEEYGKGRDSYNAFCVSNALQYMKEQKCEILPLGG